MIKALISIILLAAGIVVFFIKTQYYIDDVKTLREQTTAYNEAMANSRKIKEVTNKLLNKYNAISQGDIERINIILPAQIDSIKIAAELESIMKKNGMTLKSANTKEAKKSKKTIKTKNKGKSKENSFDVAEMNFKASGSYESFRAFLNDLERSLRVIDVNAISFSSKNTDVYDFDFTASVYWLKPVMQ